MSQLIRNIDATRKHLASDRERNFLFTKNEAIIQRFEKVLKSSLIPAAEDKVWWADPATNMIVVAKRIKKPFPSSKFYVATVLKDKNMLLRPHEGIELIEKKNAIKLASKNAASLRNSQETSIPEENKDGRTRRLTNSTDSLTKVAVPITKVAIKEDTELGKHQKRVIKKLKKSDSLIVYHGLGSGKTLTSLAAGESLQLPTKVVGPASLRGNFEKEKKKHDIDTDVTYHSYHKPPNLRKDVKKPQGERLSDSLLVFDEAHNMGQVTSKRSKYPDKYQGKKELFLTGTPIRNNPSELAPLMRGVGIPISKNPKAFRERFIEEEKVSPGWFRQHIMGVKPGVKRKPKNLKQLKSLLKGKVDYHESATEGYPSTTESALKVEMSKDQHKTYKAYMKGNAKLLYKIRKGLPPSKQEAKNLNSFLAASRQISNTPRAHNTRTTAKDETKINAATTEITKRLKSDPNYRGVTYSNYLEAGVQPLSKRLTDLKIPHATFTGKLTKKEKAKALKDYNEGRIKHLLISGAGAEGLDLKGTKLMQIMEPHWNDPRIEQVKGRAVRFKSHEHLPPSERKVEIQHLQSIPRKTGLPFFKKRHGGTDEYLTQMSKEKAKLNKAFLDVLKDVGSKDA